MRRDSYQPPPLRRHRDPPPSRVPTLDELQRNRCWLWLYCDGWECPHHAPVALVPLIIRWGPGTSGDKLRRSARCTRCGHKGASLQHPSYADRVIGCQPFPRERVNG